MSAIKVKTSGNFKNLRNFCKQITKHYYLNKIEQYAQQGVEALKSATPKDTGVTANSWSYEIVRTPHSIKIEWKNANTTKEGTPIVLLLQYGHGTREGGYVQGKDFINPSIKPTFDKIEEVVWKEVIE